MALIVALCHYGGIRCPSELLPLTWNDVNRERGRFFVRSPKTEHHEGGTVAVSSSSANTGPYLEDAFEQAEPGTVYLVNRYRDANPDPYGHGYNASASGPAWNRGASRSTTSAHRGKRSWRRNTRSMSFVSGSATLR